MLYKAWRRPREGLAKLEWRHRWIERYQKLEQYWQTSYFVAVVFLEIFVRQSNKVRMEASHSKNQTAFHDRGLDGGILDMQSIPMLYQCSNCTSSFANKGRLEKSLFHGICFEGCIMQN